MMEWERRYWPKVNKTEGCWLWTAALSSGYGVLGFPDGNGRWGGKYAHRLSWEIHFGPIPAGSYVLHHCDTPPCVRPDHLFLGTQADNNADMRAKGRGYVPTAKRGREHPWFRSDHSGERNAHARLTGADIAEIRRLAAMGYRQNAAIARRFGITKGHVGRIVKGQAWKQT